MSELSPEITEQIIDVCKAGASDAGKSLSSALDGTLQIVDVVSGPLPDRALGPGLGIVFHVGDAGMALLLPESTNLLTSWYAAPDSTGESKLQTLAQELAMLFVPDNLEVTKFAAGTVANLSSALQGAKPADPLGCIQLSIQGDQGNGAFYLCWPLEQPANLLAQIPKNSSNAAPAGNATTDADSEQPGDHDLSALPTYSRSLLSIRIPVVVNLATTKMKVEDIVNLGQGAIIQFEKSCDDSLDLEAGGHKLAAGEAVKVGDKFGLRITSIRLPNERYQTVGKRPQGDCR